MRNLFMWFPSNESKINEIFDADPEAPAPLLSTSPAGAAVNVKAEDKPPALSLKVQDDEELLWPYCKARGFPTNKLSNCLQQMFSNHSSKTF